MTEDSDSRGFSRKKGIKEMQGLTPGDFHMINDWFMVLCWQLSFIGALLIMICVRIRK